MLHSQVTAIVLLLAFFDPFLDIINMGNQEQEIQSIPLHSTAASRVSLNVSPPLHSSDTNRILPVSDDTLVTLLGDSTPTSSRRATF
jgi:hypothetical protein